MKAILILLLSGLLISCGHIKTRTQISDKPPGAETQPGDKEEPVSPDEPEGVVLILGPGSVRALSHAGVLQSLERSKIPIKAIAGVEWGAMVAGFYAVTGSSSKLQWELQKINSKVLPKRGFISKKYEGEPIREFLKANFSSKVLNSRVERGDASFACSTASVVDGKQKKHTRGKLIDVLSRCMVSPPLLRSKKLEYSDLFALKDIVKPYLEEEVRAVVYVDVLDSPGYFTKEEIQNNKESAFLWNELKWAHKRQLDSLQSQYPKFRVLNIKNNNQPLFKNKNSNMLFLAGKRAGNKLVRDLDY